MSDDGKLDYYEILQVSANAEPDTIHRIYRLLAQRFHPDNQESGNADRFHQIHEAYTVLSDPERRAKYDVAYHQLRQDRWRLQVRKNLPTNIFRMQNMNPPWICT
jgi:DnaJ-class molecular chaperone